MSMKGGEKYPGAPWRTQSYVKTTSPGSRGQGRPQKTKYTSGALFRTYSIRGKMNFGWSTKTVCKVVEKVKSPQKIAVDHEKK